MEKYENILKFFVNREKELEILMKNAYALPKGVSKNIVMISPRRMGKTTLIIKHISELNFNKNLSNVIPVYVNCQLALDWSELFDRMLDKALESYSEKTGDKLIITKISYWIKEKLGIALNKLSEIEAELGGYAGEYFKLRLSMREEKKVNHVKLAEKALSSLEEFAEKKNIYFEIFFDEFQQVGKFENLEAVIAAMREAFQFKRRTFFLLSGSSVSFMEKIYTKESSPFFKQLFPIYLSFLNKDDIKKYVKLRGLEFNDDGIKKLKELSNGIPDYLSKIVEEARKIHPREVEEAFDTIITREARTFAALFESLTISQQKVMVTIAKGKKSFAEIKEEVREEGIGAILANMVFQGYLYKIKKGRYDIFDVGLKRYIQLMLKEGII